MMFSSVYISHIKENISQGDTLFAQFAQFVVLCFAGCTSRNPLKGDDKGDIS